MNTVVNGQLRDQLIVGLRANEIRKELLKLPNLTLVKAVALEASIADCSLYEDPPFAAPNVVNKVANLKLNWFQMPSTKNPSEMPGTLAKWARSTPGRRQASGNTRYAMPGIPD